MSTTPQLIRANKVVLKSCSLFFGYLLWNCLSEQQTIALAVPVTLSFFNQDETKHIEAPEHVTMIVAGKRKALIQTKLLASVQCDASRLHEGKQAVPVFEQQILLPQSVTLLNCKPRTLTVTVTPTKA